MGLAGDYMQRPQLTRSRHRIGYRENLQRSAIKNGSVGSSIGPPSVHASPLYQFVESLQRAVADVLEWSPMGLSVLLHLLAEAAGATRGEGCCSVGGAVPAALCESLVDLGGCAWHVVALQAPMPARGMVGVFQIAHRALALCVIKAAGVNVKLASLNDVPKESDADRSWSG